MILLLSEELDNNTKERIVNATYEVSEVMPVFLDYQKPIMDLCRLTGGENISKYIKIPGDDIVKINKELQKQLIDALKPLAGKQMLFHAMKYRKEIRSSSVEITKIINNFEKEDLPTIKEYASDKNETVFQIGLKNSEKFGEVEMIEISSDSHEDLVPLLDEKLNKTNIVELTIEQVSEQKLAELNQEKELTKADYVIKSAEKEKPAPKGWNTEVEAQSDAEMPTEIADSSGSYVFMDSLIRGMSNAPNTGRIHEQMDILRRRMTGHTVPNYFGTGGREIRLTEPWHQSL